MLHARIAVHSFSRAVYRYTTAGGSHKLLYSVPASKNKAQKVKSRHCLRDLGLGLELGSRIGLTEV